MKLYKKKHPFANKTPISQDHDLNLPPCTHSTPILYLQSELRCSLLCLFLFLSSTTPSKLALFCGTPLATIHSTHFFLPSAACWLLYWSQTLIVIIYITQSMIRWIGGIINPWSDQLLFDGGRRWRQKCVIFGADDGQWWQKKCSFIGTYGGWSWRWKCVIIGTDGDRRWWQKASSLALLGADDGDESASSLLSVLKAANNGDTHVLSLALMEANDGN